MKGKKKMLQVFEEPTEKVLKGE